MAYDKLNEPENIYLELNRMSTTAPFSYVYINIFFLNIQNEFFSLIKGICFFKKDSNYIYLNFNCFFFLN